MLLMPSKQVEFFFEKNLKIASTRPIQILNNHILVPRNFKANLLALGRFSKFQKSLIFQLTNCYIFIFFGVMKYHCRKSKKDTRTLGHNPRRVKVDDLFQTPFPFSA